MKLHQLINGTWIDLSTVTQIVASAPSKVTNGRGGICAVNCGDWYNIINCATLEEAETIRDGIAAMVNRAATKALAKTNIEPQ